MKAKITGLTTELKVGQLWRNATTGRVYLAVKVAHNKPIVLLNTETYSTIWSVDGGFDGDLFTYVGNLEIVE